MTTASKTVHNHLVYYDTEHEHRWLEVVGPKRARMVLDGGQYSADSFTVTVATAGTITGDATLVGGGFVITPGAVEDQGVQAQQLGEAFYLSGAYPAYFGIRFAMLDADQTDFVAGLCITDTTLLGGMTDGMYFRVVDESAALTFVIEKDSAETVHTLTTLTDATYVDAEFTYDGDYVYVYLDGTLALTVAVSATNFPNNEMLTPSLAVLTGEAVANTVTFPWCRAFQIAQ